jgi:hypothetical protein
MEIDDFHASQTLHRVKEVCKERCRGERIGVSAYPRIGVSAYRRLQSVINLVKTSWSA